MFANGFAYFYSSPLVGKHVTDLTCENIYCLGTTGDKCGRCLPDTFLLVEPEGVVGNVI